jgi:DNA-binding transcriptional ArsR family regulator
VLAGVDYIEADDVRRRPFRVAVTPLPSLLMVVTDAVGPGRNGTPQAWRASVQKHLRARDYETLAPFVTRGLSRVPDPLVGCANPPGESLQDGIERMIATPLDTLTAEIATSRIVSGHDAWSAAERDPGRWLRRYVTSLLRAWKGFAPIWRQARPALGREVERVGVATALDAQLELLDGLVRRSSVEDGRWCIHGKFATGRKDFPDTGLVLIPMVTGPVASIIGDSGGTIARVGYPLRSVVEVCTEDVPTAALEGLLGIPRARILRAARTPTTVGCLAEILQAVPSAATHHVGALEAAGLVTRARRGRNVMVELTARGEALLRLYDETAREHWHDGRAAGRQLRYVCPARSS